MTSLYIARYTDNRYPEDNETFGSSFDKEVAQKMLNDEYNSWVQRQKADAASDKHWSNKISANDHHLGIFRYTLEEIEVSNEELAAAVLAYYAKYGCSILPAGTVTGAIP